MKLISSAFNKDGLGQKLPLGVVQAKRPISNRDVRAEMPYNAFRIAQYIADVICTEYEKAKEGGQKLVVQFGEDYERTACALYQAMVLQVLDGAGLMQSAKVGVALPRTMGFKDLCKDFVPLKKIETASGRWQFYRNNLAKRAVYADLQDLSGSPISRAILSSYVIRRGMPLKYIGVFSDRSVGVVESLKKCADNYFSDIRETVLDEQNPMDMLIASAHASDVVGLTEYYGYPELSSSSVLSQLANERKKIRVLPVLVSPDEMARGLGVSDYYYSSILDSDYPESIIISGLGEERFSYGFFKDKADIKGQECQAIRKYLNGAEGREELLKGVAFLNLDS